MTGLERARRIVAGAYACRHADVITLELLGSLERENGALRFHITRGRMLTGRSVFGLTVSASILILGVAVGLNWYQHSAEGSCLQRGFDAGYRRVAPAGPVNGACDSDSEATAAHDEPVTPA